MQRRQRAVVAGVHRLEHVERLAATHLADDDPVGPHAQRVADQVADADLALALDVRRTALEADDVTLVELELGGVLDRDDAFVVGDHRRQHVEHRRLAGARTAADEDVGLAPHARVDELCELRCERADPDEVLDAEDVGGELPDGEGGAVERERRDDRVDTGTVGEPGVDHRRRFVDATADLGDDPVDHAVEVVRGEEARFGLVETPGAFDEDLLLAVDHDLGDLGVVEELLDRAEPEHVVGDGRDERHALLGAERDPLGLDDLVEVLDDELLELTLGQRAVVELGAEAVEQRLVGAALDLGEGVRPGGRDLARLGAAPRATPGGQRRRPPRQRWRSAGDAR